MIAGITIDGMHSYYQYGLRMLEREIGSPPKDDHTERVPYSNITYDFDEILGISSYGERTLRYVLECICMHPGTANARMIQIRKWLQWTGRKNLYDDGCKGYHFEVRQPEIQIRESHGVYTAELTFRANPGMIPDVNAGFTAGTCHYPDVDMDGAVTATDASLILQAASAIGAGEESGLTPEQLLAADADMDGVITATDASLVMQYAASVGAGNFRDTPQNWTRFLNRYLGLEEVVY